MNWLKSVLVELSIIDPPKEKPKREPVEFGNVGAYYTCFVRLAKVLEFKLLGIPYMRTQKNEGTRIRTSWAEAQGANAHFECAKAAGVLSLYQMRMYANNNHFFVGLAEVTWAHDGLLGCAVMPFIRQVCPVTNRFESCLLEDSHMSVIQQTMYRRDMDPEVAVYISDAVRALITITPTVNGQAMAPGLEFSFYSTGETAEQFVEIVMKHLRENDSFHTPNGELLKIR